MGLGMESFLFDNSKDLPLVLPHHLFMLAAVAASKKNNDYTMGDIKTKSKESRSRTTSVTEKTSNNDKVENKNEKRKILDLDCYVDRMESGRKLTILVHFDDGMNRKMECQVSDNDTPYDLAKELVDYGLVSECDEERVRTTIESQLKTR